MTHVSVDASDRPSWSARAPASLRWSARSSRTLRVERSAAARRRPTRRSPPARGVRRRAGFGDRAALSRRAAAAPRCRSARDCRSRSRRRRTPTMVERFAVEHESSGRARSDRRRIPRASSDRSGCRRCRAPDRVLTGLEQTAALRPQSPDLEQVRRARATSECAWRHRGRSACPGPQLVRSQRLEARQPRATRESPACDAAIASISRSGLRLDDPAEPSRDPRAAATARSSGFAMLKSSVLAPMASASVSMVTAL